MKDCSGQFLSSFTKDTNPLCLQLWLLAISKLTASTEVFLKGFFSLFLDVMDVHKSAHPGPSLIMPFNLIIKIEGSF